RPSTSPPDFAESTTSRARSTSQIVRAETSFGVLKPKNSQQTPSVAQKGTVANAKSRTPPPAPNLQAHDSDLRALEVSASHCLTAGEALSLYQQFEATHRMTLPQELSLKGNRHRWEERACNNLARLGDKWVPEAEVLRSRREAKKLVDQ